MSILRSAAWVYGKVFLNQALNLVTVGIIARHVEPRAFGLLALATISIRLINVFISNGINQFIIYDRGEGAENRVHTAFWLNLLFSTVIACTGFVLANSIAAYFKEADLTLILQVIVLRIPLDSILQISDSLLSKRFRFKEIELRDSVLLMIASIAGIGMAIRGMGIWSLILPNMFILPLQILYSFKHANWKPRFIFLLRDVKEVLHYSKSIVASSLTTFVISESDTLLIGRVLGTSALGMYNVAWRSSNLIVRLLVNSSNKLMFPWFTKHAEDKEKFNTSFLWVLQTIALIAFPLLFIMMALAEDYILLIYGDQWLEAVLPLQILMIYAIRFAIGAPVGTALNSIGRPDLIYKINLLTIPFYLGAIFVGSRYGIVGVAIGVTLVRTIFGIINFALLSKYCGIAPSLIVRSVLHPLLAGTFAFSALIGIKHLLRVEGSLAPFLDLLLFGTLGLLLYAMSMRFIFKRYLRRFLNEMDVVDGRVAKPLRTVFMLP